MDPYDIDVSVGEGGELPYVTEVIAMVDEQGSRLHRDGVGHPRAMVSNHDVGGREEVELVKGTKIGEGTHVMDYQVWKFRMD
mmetsp:Transcript_1768/g.3240  ORF Transcript_1768/g.3240 Transcript_1768/m.3240 type:complete len:82 (+) Transcript_1768:174-419(+)